MQNIIILFILAFAVYKCSGGKYGTDRVFGAPENLSFDRYEEMPVSVMFWHNKRAYELDLGQTIGTSSCLQIASSYAESENLDYSEWSYVCCTHEEGSNCYRKIR